MPRWIWYTLAGLLLMLWWASHRSFEPVVATSGSGGGAISCPLPPTFVNPDQPLQSDVHGQMSPFRLGDAVVSPLAGFSLQGRVLSREDYSLGRESRYSPTDLAMGWGPMSQPGMAERLEVSQSGRWYRYRWGNGGPPLPPDQIARNSANMHMVPADRNVARALDTVSAGQLIRIDGWLIRIDGDDGGRWQSSLSRDDQGNGACELIYVCSIKPR